MKKNGLKGGEVNLGTYSKEKNVPGVFHINIGNSLRDDVLDAIRIALGNPEHDEYDIADAVFDVIGISKHQQDMKKGQVLYKASALQGQSGERVPGAKY